VAAIPACGDPPGSFLPVLVLIGSGPATAKEKKPPGHQEDEGGDPDPDGRTGSGEGVEALSGHRGRRGRQARTARGLADAVTLRAGAR